MSEEGLDESRYTLTEHLTELRGRLFKSIVAVVLTSTVCLAFAPEILEYSIQPLTNVLRSKNRVVTILIHNDPKRSTPLSERLDDHKKLQFLGMQNNMSQVTGTVKEQVALKRPVDLILVATEAIGDDGALVSDLLEGIEPTPFVAYLVRDAKDPVVTELQLEGALVILDPPRNAVLNRVLRRAAAAAGKVAQGDKLVVLSPLEPFFAYLKIALVCGLFLACPIWLYQSWCFVAPGLYAKEKKAVLPGVMVASLLFVGGGLFAYYAMFPLMFDVLVNQMMPSSLAGSFTVEKYLGLLLRVTVAFGVVFELPLALAVLSAVGIISADGLRRYRKYAIILAFVVGAFLTPADPLSMVMMALPLIVFYEFGILFAVVAGKKRERAERSLEED